MPPSARVRDWATIDYYALLGVDVHASGDDIARAFRTVAKRTHPDATGSTQEFQELVAAYTVLSDHRTRRDYDRVRAGTATVAERPVAPPRTAPATSGPFRWTRKRAWLAVGGGILLTLLGGAVGVLTWHLHERDALERNRFVAVLAQRVDVRGRSYVAFRLPDASHMLVPEPSQHGDPAAPGSLVKIRYDPAHPEHVVLDASTFGRDITLAIVAVKLLVGGPVFVVVGRRRLRRSQGATAVR